MDPATEKINRLADGISLLAKANTLSKDTEEKREAKVRLVRDAEHLIDQIVDPFNASIYHVTNVCFYLLYLWRPPIFIGPSLPLIASTEPTVLL